VKAVIVGGWGYIGHTLYQSVSDIYDAVRTTSSESKNDPSAVMLQLEKPDCFNYEIIGESDIVFLTAAISAPDACSHDHDRAWAVNVTGTSRFIENVISRGGRIIFFSSDTVYGENTEETDENSACIPAGEYAAMKYEVERRFTSTDLFKSIRLSYVFSKDDKFTRYLNGCAVRGETAEIFHPFYRAVIHRDDVVAGAIELARRWNEFPGQTVNFGGPQLLSRKDFARILKDEALPGIRYEISEPSADFFENRPRIINMISPMMTSLLGRSSHTLADAAGIEFNNKGAKA